MKREYSNINVFPFKSVDDNGDDYHSLGLTKREYFAAMAMQGLLSYEEGFQKSESQIASYAVVQADALIKELDK